MISSSIPTGHSKRTTPRASRRSVTGIAAFLLSFTLTLLFAAAPTPAQAAIPTGPSDGMFDCLGSYDWGCHIIGFMFEGKQVAYLKDIGTKETVMDAPTTVERALPIMMAFFSNAILIIASLKLLYELIQMVAETAHTGHVGGKNTNQIWAPIRLVIAIGLLVPLSSGMNSGQYIIIQVAKWGSGLASQTWKVFAEALGKDQTLSAPPAPSIQNLASNTAKSVICMKFVNHFAGGTSGCASVGTCSSLVSPRPQNDGQNNKVVYGNMLHNNICGELLYRTANQHLADPVDRQLAQDLTANNNELFLRHKDAIAAEANKIADAFIAGTPLPSTAALQQEIEKYAENMKKMFDAYKEEDRYTGQALKQITDSIARGAGDYGWTSAGSWFLAITRAQGSLITAGLNIPQATGPDRNTLDKEYRDASALYTNFTNYFATSYRPQNDSSIPINDGRTLANPNVGIEGVDLGTQADIDRDLLGMLIDLLSAPGEQVIDVVLGFMDNMGYQAGLWTNTSRAFGDLGGSTNPFGEIAAFGQKKIRLGLNYLGTALAISGAGALISYPLPAIGTFTMWIGAIFTSFATLLLIAGTLLGFVVPMLPFIRFFFAIITWLGTLLEGMICLPFLALAHLTPGGEGFSGSNTRTGYLLIFQIFLRPALILFGLVASIIIFYVGARFLNASFYAAAGSVGIFQGGLAFVTKIIFAIMYAGIIYILANTSFKLIDQMPKNALRWMGQQAHEDSHEEAAQNLFLQSVAPAMGMQAASRYVQAGPNAMGSLGGTMNKAGKEHRNDKEKQQRALMDQREKQKSGDDYEAKYGPGIRTPEQANLHMLGKIADQTSGSSLSSSPPPTPSKSGSSEQDPQRFDDKKIEAGNANQGNESQDAGQLRNQQQQTASRVNDLEGRTNTIEQRTTGLTPGEQRQTSHDAFQARAQKARDNKPKKKDS